MEDRAAGLPTLYLETTIVSYLTARPSRDIIVFSHQELTRQWWEEERRGYRLFVSPRVIEEAQQGDAAAAQRRMEYLTGSVALEPTEEVEALATLVQGALRIAEKAVGDAYHLAYVIHYEIDYLLTWNCVHLANAQRRRLLAALSRERGLWLPIICTPAEMVEWGTEE